MNLLTFPCNGELASSFCRKFDTSNCAALILEKQKDSLRDILRMNGVSRVYILSEEFYGKMSNRNESSKVLKEIYQERYTHGYFPLNDFCGNVALLMATLVPRVTAINPSSAELIAIDLPEARKTCISINPGYRERVRKAQKKLVHQLKPFYSEIYALAQGQRAGEKPSAGIIKTYPYDCEVLARYAYASSHVRGHVLEIGCGLGFGAFLMAELNPQISIQAVDSDPEAIRLAQKIWATHDRLAFKVAQAENLPYSSRAFDSAVCYEVLEHLKEPELLLGEVRRTLSRGGTFIGSTPNWRLFPYRVNRNLSCPADALRQEGIWPWHLQEFDEARIRNLVRKFGFHDVGITYPTFSRGVNLYENLRELSFPSAIKKLSTLKWSADDFDLLNQYHPLFSGFSFVFSAVKRGEGR